jgi:hypothetical protein
MITLACATPHTESSFIRETFLGRSLIRLGPLRNGWDLRITYENRAGLPVVYNESLKVADPDKPLVFLHDDVSIQDLYFADKLVLALRNFDLVGIAGGNPPGAAPKVWYDIKTRSWPMKGLVPHTSRAQPEAETLASMIMNYGPTPGACEFIDGLAMAMIPKRILEANLAFDPRFDFHHYDLDFSKQARLRNLRVGTWPLWLVHSGASGAIEAGWQASYEIFRNKYEPSEQT